MPVPLALAAAAADLLLVGGRIHTMDPRRPVAQALAVRAGRILAVGSDREIRSHSGPDTLVLDLAGRAVLPGLIDTHTHAWEAARSRVSGALDLGLPEVRSLGEALDRVRERAAGLASGGWILGDRWDESKWPERRYLRRTDLDPVSAGRPAYLEHVSGHAAVVNSEALRMAGISRVTRDPPGGAIERDRAGEPTGVLKDAAMALVASRVPAVPFGAPQRLEAAARAGQEAVAVGLTTLHDSALSAEGMRAYQEAEDAGLLKVRVVANPLVPSEGTEEALAHLRAQGVHTGHGSPRLRWGAVKFFTDGGMAARTIAVTPPGLLDEPANVGLLRWETPRLTAAMRAVRELGWQITVHAIGDRAIAQALEALEGALGKDARGHRSRIVHCGVTTPALLDRIRRLNVLVDHNPAFVYWIGDWFRPYGPERVAASYRGRSYEEQGIVVSAGSDASVTPLSPWWGIWAAVERREYRTGEVLAPGERVALPAVLRWYTANGAYAGFEEGEKGSLSAGRLADLIVLDRDPFAVPVAQLKDVRVLATLVGGEPVHADPGLGWPRPAGPQSDAQGLTTPGSRL